MTKELMDKAERALASARLLLADGDADGATNRAYYAMFDAATAAMVWAGAVTVQMLPKTHSGLISTLDSISSKLVSFRRSWAVPSTIPMNSA